MKTRRIDWIEIGFGILKWVWCGSFVYGALKIIQKVNGLQEQLLLAILFMLAFISMQLGAIRKDFNFWRERSKEK